jgi:hypothetical protein
MLCVCQIAKLKPSLGSKVSGHISQMETSMYKKTDFLLYSGKSYLTRSTFQKRKVGQYHAILKIGSLEYGRQAVRTFLQARFRRYLSKEQEIRPKSSPPTPRFFLVTQQRCAALSRQLIMCNRARSETWFT